MEKTAENDIDMGAVPRVVPGLNLASLSLSQEEGFLFSRVDGSVTVEQLVRASGMTTGASVTTSSDGLAARLTVNGPVEAPRRVTMAWVVPPFSEMLFSMIARLSSAAVNSFASVNEPKAPRVNGFGV